MLAVQPIFLNMIAVADALLFLAIFINSIRALSRSKESVSSIQKLENKIDELRIQVGIMNGRMGDRGTPIQIPFEEVRRKSPGRPPGSKSKPKNVE